MRLPVILAFPRAPITSGIGLLVLTTLVLASAGPLAAQSPFTKLIPFRNAGKNTPSTKPEDFQLSQRHGPWLILAATFAGEKAEAQASELIVELRSKHRLVAYLHQQTYEHSAMEEGTMLNPRGQKAKMRYANVADNYQAFAVLIGDFQSVKDPALETTLQKVKYLRPECLDTSKRQDTNQSFVGIKEWYRRISNDPNRNKKGPMGGAFATRNPLIPAGYFAAGGVDDFVAKMNQGVEYSLLDNPGRFTVRVATFRGLSSINQREILDLQNSADVTDKLAVAADKANRLTTALRKQGIEAYEFHDRTESIVTIGNFDSEGTTPKPGALDVNGRPLPAGTVVINPDMMKIIEKYRAQQAQIPGVRVVGMQPRMLNGIPFDVQPAPMPVPRRSLAADYARDR